MADEDWEAHWNEGRTAFHEGQPNELLVPHVQKLGKPGRVLVPLAGKAVDMTYLAGRGHDVVGVELVQLAIDSYFKEAGKTPTSHRLGAHEHAYYADGVTLVRSDIFAVTPESLGRFDAIYDRAALVALPPERRADYAKRCLDLLNAKGGIFLIAFSYDQSKMPGPPWSVDETEVRRCYAGRTIDILQQRTVPTTRPAGEFNETAYWIS